jgi:hypothetical protein
MSILQKSRSFLLSIFREFPRRHLIVSSALAGCLLALTAYPGKYTEVKRQIAEPITIVIEEPAPAPEVAGPSNFDLNWNEQRVASGDNLSYSVPTR